nr:hypothetical protein [Tanacetum cinerariifolium]
KSYESHEDHKKLYDVLEKSLERDYSNQLLSDLEEAHQKKRKRRASSTPGISRASGSSQMPPPLLPLSNGTSGSAQQQGCEAPSSSKSTVSALQSMAWTISDTRYELAVGSVVLCYGGGQRDVVVVIIEVVVVDVGSREPDCDVARLITRVVIGGTEEMS